MIPRSNGLQAALRSRFAAALADGSLRPIATETLRIGDGGIDFLVRYIAGQRDKPRASDGAARKDPFSPPYERALTVAPIAPAHMGLLNKFPVIDRHLLIVTERDEPQEALLTSADFEALLRTLASIDGLGFYNGGTDAGASQAHKHLQLVPLPLAAGEPGFPLLPLLEAVTVEHGGTSAIPGLGFKHAVATVDVGWWHEPVQGAVQAHRMYRQLLKAVGIGIAGDYQSAPYNLLMTRHWMWLVPRSREGYQGIPVNALGYAGALMVPHPNDVEKLRALRPLTLLFRTGVAD